MINYGSYTATKSISVPQAIPLTVVSGGDGSGVTTFTVSTRTATSVSIVGGYFYDTIAGNSGQNTTRVLTIESVGNAFVAPNPLYIKVASGTARLVFTSKKLTKINAVAKAGVNSPIVIGTLSDIITLGIISDGITAGSNFITNCTKLVNLTSLDQTEGVVSGTLNNSLGMIRMTIVGNQHTVSYNVALANAGIHFEVAGDNMNFYGDLTASNPGLFYGGALRNCTGDASAWTNLIYWQTECPAEIHDADGITVCGILNITHTVLSESDVNSILAGLRTNVAVPKTYSEPSRTFNLTGAAGTSAPTGQGLVDKQFLNDWVGGAGQRNTVTTR